MAPGLKRLSARTPAGLGTDARLVLLVVFSVITYITAYWAVIISLGALLTGQSFGIGRIIWSLIHSKPDWGIATALIELIIIAILILFFLFLVAVSLIPLVFNAIAYSLAKGLKVSNRLLNLNRALLKILLMVNIAAAVLFYIGMLIGPIAKH